MMSMLCCNMMCCCCMSGSRADVLAAGYVLRIPKNGME